MTSSESAYSQLLNLARRQAEAAERGDINAVIALMADRADALSDAPSATGPELDAVREVLRLDRDLATALRTRMIAVRNEAVALQQGRTALSGYRPPAGEHRSRRLNAFS